MWGDMGHAGFGGLYMIFWWLLPIAAVALVAWAFARSRGGQRDPGGDDPIRILEARYARGEIDREEFEQRKRDLRG